MTSSHTEFLSPAEWVVLPSAMSAAAVAIIFANVSDRQATGLRRRFVRQPEAGKRHAGQADAKFL